MIRLIKRFFVETTGAVGIALIAISATAVASGSSPFWLGVPLAWSFTLGYFAYLLVARPSTHSRHLWPVYAGAAIGTAAAVFAGPVAALLAAISLAAILTYAYWYSRQHVPASVLSVGAALPDFPLTALDGSTVSSSVLTAQPHVILFYRGNWCPFCMVQVKEIAAQYRELDERGVAVALISPQRSADTAELATRFDVPMAFYVDEGGVAAAMLDLTQAGGTPVIYGVGTNGDTVVPTVVITNATGTVVWLEHADNHRIRPEPSTFLEVLDREGITSAR
jgi:peroxiredoxin